jgi:hypothetical protein
MRSTQLRKQRAVEHAQDVAAQAAAEAAAAAAASAGDADDLEQEVVIVPKQRPVYAGESWLNRYGIAPGYSWDGVDRSTGFEKRFFKKQHDKASLKKRAYAWSVSDM